MATVKSALTDLMNLDRQGLVDLWVAEFGCPTPPKVKQDLLRQILGYRIQVKLLGGLSKTDQRRLLGQVGEPLSQGSHLIRVWNGETHQVTVRDKIYLYQGKEWRSLSAIARHITGTNWSGPVFFGIKDRS
jgi:hypothetical protein